MKINEITEQYDEEEFFYSDQLEPVTRQLFQKMYPEAQVEIDDDEYGDGYLNINAIDPSGSGADFKFSIGVTHVDGENVISVGDANAGVYKGIVGKLIKFAADLLKSKHPENNTTLVVQHDANQVYWKNIANKLGIEYEENRWY